MEPFAPPAKGGYRYVSKFTDDYSRMKEVYLLRNKSEAAESLHQYNMTVTVPLGLRIEIVRCDKGGEYIGKEFKTLCVNAGINVEYTATNMPQQNGVSERDEQTLAQIIRCLMKDGNFPPSLWGELIFTAAYLSNRSPHSALGGATLYFRMHNKEASSRDCEPSEPEHSPTARPIRGSWTTGRSKESCADLVKTAGLTGSTTQPRVRSWKAAT